MASGDLIEKFIEYMREKRKTDASIKTYETILKIADRQLPYGLDSANEDEIRSWIWRVHLSDNSRALYFAVINGFFTWALKRGILDFNPVAAIDAPGVVIGFPRVATNPQVAFITTQAPEPFRIWGKLAAYEGMRCIEVSRCETDHISQETTRIYRGKGNKPRIVATHPVVWAAVQDLPPGRITDCDARQISQRFKKYCYRIDESNLSMHRLRGWHATQSYAATKDIRAVQRNLGHIDPSTTARYIAIADDAMTAAVTGLPVFG